jgi:hypothetical protein
VNNRYDCSESGSAPDGEAFTEFLGTLNRATSSDGVAVAGCFANHCDWRLPQIEELRGILPSPYPGCLSRPCIDPRFGPTQSGFCRSATTDANRPWGAWFVDFRDGYDFFDGKNFDYYVREMRSSP